MPCKITKNCGSGGSNKIKTKLACILEAGESTRLRMGESLPNHHEDHIAGKGSNSLQHYNLVHKFIPMPQAIQIPAAKGAVDKEWEKLEKISAWNLTKVRSKKEVIDEARTKGAKFHFASLMDTCHLKNAELEAKHQKYKGRVVLRGGRFGVLCCIQWTRIISIKNDSSKSHGYHLQTATRVRGTSSWRSICLYTGKNGGCSINIENSQIGMSRQLDSSASTQMGLNHGPVWKTQSFLLKGICTVILWQDLCGKGNLRKSYWSMAVRKFQIGNVSLYIVKKDYSWQCGRYKTGRKETKH